MGNSEIHSGRRFGAVATPKLRLLAGVLTAGATLLGCGGDGGNDMPATTTSISPATCTELSGKTLANNTVTVLDAAIVAATAALPEYCVVHAGFNDSTLKFEAHLPTSGWNSKLTWFGGGGFDGHFSQPTDAFLSKSIVAEKYATVATNGGYDAPADLFEWFKATFAFDAVKLADFTYLSNHRALPAAKELILRAYGAAATKSYFEGCSMGGHEAMIESQRYPNDFDGIVARAPAGSIMVFIQFNRVAKLVRTPGASLNAAKQTLLANAVLAQCDGLDGVTDGIISKPAACTYDPAALRCAGGADTGDTCLSDAQIGTVNAVTTAITTSDGVFTHPGYYFGGENSPNGWGEYIWANPAIGDSLQGLFSDGFIRSFITRDLAYDTAQWDVNQWLSEMSIVGSMYHAFNPDLSGLQARGAKMIVMNGATDTSVTPKDASRYYDMVVQTMGQANADKVLETFIEPGVGHCVGGVGPDTVDLMKALTTWVEAGTPPSAQNLTLSKLDATTGAVTMTRPLCKYPSYPRYNGSGDVNAAGSFTCSTQ
jgi:Tannase and feruloyl esterase.